MKRVHVIYRLEKIENVGIANMTVKEADAAIEKAVKRMEAELTDQILSEFVPPEEEPTIEEPPAEEVPAEEVPVEEHPEEEKE